MGNILRIFNNLIVFAFMITELQRFLRLGLISYNGLNLGHCSTADLITMTACITLVYFFFFLSIAQTLLYLT